MAHALRAHDMATFAPPRGHGPKSGFELRLGCISLMCHCPAQQLAEERETEIDPARCSDPPPVRVCGSLQNLPESCSTHAPSTNASDATSTGVPRTGGPLSANDSCESLCSELTQSQCASDGTEAAVEPREALGRALRQGRLHEAERQLARLKASEDAEPADLERLRRIGTAFRAAVVDLEADPGEGWASEQMADMSYSYRLGDGEFQLVATTESSADAVRAMAAILEADLCKGYKPNVTEGRPLGDAEADPCDSVWQIMQKGKLSGALEDNISQISVVDALDEDIGSVWACMYPPEDVASLDVHGVTLPAVRPGATREGGWRTSFRITPLQNAKGAGRPGFRMSTALSFRPSQTGWAFLTRTPGWVLRPMMTRSAKEALESFAKHMATCPELQQRIQASPRSAFYARIGRRLAGETPEPVPRAPAALAALPSGPPREGDREEATAGAPEPRAALTFALRQGRVHEAERQLAHLEARGGAEPTDLERLQRVGAAVRAAMQDLDAHPGDGWVNQRMEEDLSCSYHVGDGQFQVVFTMESSGDAVRALAAILEDDLCQAYKPNVIESRILGEGEPDPFDLVRQIVQTSKFSGALEDTISQTSVVDALDEDAGSVLVCLYPLSDVTATTLRGIALPAPGPGAERKSTWRCSFRITPVPNFKGTGRRGFRMSTALCARPTSRTGLAVLMRLPGWALKPAMARSAREFLESFARHASTSKELQRRIQDSPRAAFYARMGRRLAGEAPEPLPRAAGTQAALATGGAPAHAGQQGAAAEPLRCGRAAGGSADGLLTWDDISAMLPLDWASYQD